MSSFDEKVKHTLKSYITRQHQRKQQQENKEQTPSAERCEIERKICYVQRTISELEKERRMLIQEFKQVLNEEIEIEKQRYMERMSACFEDSTMENGYV
ncbi:uncharacterized protein LOC112459478 isoform X2 [Temnothorax curvispinosus]|uniref:Uncharacterized protein LOC112453419 isoform X2 n=1 Tax=Temnothorax curvispinosus TaxID=300111 RepID=A0A6J1QCD9_9HYME|nr:uncharacterized protein LOC112453419 isoform X2 [Temnothorax curvispinosus]XP_024879358.1 uncharacterized protein LOC112459478 isoform X2 [Temnothorax curvispinosus]